VEDLRLSRRPDVTVTVARSSEEVEALRSLWQSIHVPNLDADIDYFLTVVTHLPGVIGPHVVCITRGVRSPMLVVARLEHHTFPVRIGYREVLRPSLRAVVVSFDGILGATDDDDIAICVRALRETLSHGDSDALIVQNATIGSSVHRAALDVSSRASRLHGIPTTTRWFADLPDTMDALLERRSAKARKEVRYEERRLRRKYGDGIALVRLDHGDHLVLHADLEQVAGKTYQRALGVGADSSGMGEALTSLGLRKGWLRVWMLYLQNTPVAFWWGNVHGQTFAIDTPSFDPAYSKDGVGIFVMHAMLEELCRDPLISAVDFGHGDAEYKRRYATRSLDQQDVVLLATRVRPLFVGAFISTLLVANRLAYRALRHTRLAERLRHIWRSRLAAKVSHGPEA
jgi:hypothetical protein